MQILNKLILSLSDNPRQIKDAGERLAKSAKAKSDAIIALNHEEVKVLRSEQEKLPEQREKERLMCQVRGEKKLQKKASAYRFSATLLSYASLILSVSGASGTNAILNIGETIRNPFAIAIFVLQTTLLGYYSSENQVKHLFWVAGICMIGLIICKPTEKRINADLTPLTPTEENIEDTTEENAAEN